MTILHIIIILIFIGIIGGTLVVFFFNRIEQIDSKKKILNRFKTIDLNFLNTESQLIESNNQSQVKFNRYNHNRL
jgi:hypothetical protein